MRQYYPPSARAAAWIIVAAFVAVFALAGLACVGPALMVLEAMR